MKRRRFSSLAAIMAWFLVLAGALDDSRGTCASAADAQLEEFQVALQFTFGLNGAPRPNVFIPGEIAFISTRLSGMGLDDDGKTDLTTAMELLTSEGELIGKLKPQHTTYFLRMGGGAYMGSARLRIPPHFRPGDYRIKMQSVDNIGGQRVTQELTYTVTEPSTFGAINIQLTHDVEGKYPAGATFPVGETAFLLYGITGYSIKDDRMHVKVRMRFLDESGNPVGTEQILPNEEREVPFQAVNSGPSDHRIGVHVEIPITRSGQFVFRLTVEDVIGEQEATYDIPVKAIAGTELSAGSATLPAAADRN